MGRIRMLAMPLYAGRKDEIHEERGMRRDEDSTEAVYSYDVSTKFILRGEIPPASTHAFLSAVRSAKAQSFAINR